MPPSINIISRSALFATAKTDGTLVYLSDKLSDLLGYTEEAVNQSLAAVLTTDEGQQQYLKEILQGNRHSESEAEIEIRTRNGQK